MTKFYTSESVTKGHPDKLCDLIADSVLDDCLTNDPQARVACEVLATAGHIIVAGEITADVFPDIPVIACRVLRETGYDPEQYQVECLIHRQSEDICAAVDQPMDKDATDALGAGDQGTMIGYACLEDAEFMPAPLMLARRITNLLTLARETDIIRGLGPDGKAQVSMEFEDGKLLRVDNIILSTQHSAHKDFDGLVKELARFVLAPALKGYPVESDLTVAINPSGSFVSGGPEADTGLTGRKLMVDTYGCAVPHGGGAFSGKDPTKVDRSGAYMARYVAKNIVASGLATRCQITLSYAIGIAEPVMVEVDTFGTCKACEDDCLANAVRMVFDLTPAGIIKTLNLRRPIYAATAAAGHFGHADLPWEATDKVQVLLDSVGE